MAAWRWACGSRVSASWPPRLQLSRTTVTAAYLRLRDEGFVTTRRGSGSSTALPLGAALANQPLPFDPAGAPGGLLDLAYATLPAPEGLYQAYAAALHARGVRVAGFASGDR